MVLPGDTLGIVGGGQLGRMIAMAARQHGFGVVVFAPPGDAPAAGIADAAFRAEWEDFPALDRFAAACAVATYEFENVPVATMERVARTAPVHPSPSLLAWTQDRIAEHALLDRLGIGHAAGCPVQTPEEFDAALASHGMPSRIKSARGGYDGGGQWRITDTASAGVARGIMDGETRFRFERDVPFSHEISVIIARSPTEEAVYAPFQNVHHHGILRRTTWPAAVPPRVLARAEEIARALADAVSLVGTLTVECFVVGDDVLVNELAPRVHNSGHLTIEAAATSQFEQHVRAVCGLPLGSTAARSAACMVNLLGDAARERVQLDLRGALAQPEVHVHLYGKAEVRPRRKMGHVTALGSDVPTAVGRAEAATATLRFR